MTYDYKNRNEGQFACPFCGKKRPRILIAESFFGETEKPLNLFVREIEEQTIFLPSRVFEPFRVFRGDENIISISIKDEKIEFRALEDDNPICISKNGEAEKIIAGQRFQFNMPKGELPFFQLRYKKAPKRKVLISFKG